MTGTADFSFVVYQASREEQTLALLAKFKQKLSGIKYGEDEEEKDDAKETKKDDEKTDLPLAIASLYSSGPSLISFPL